MATQIVLSTEIGGVMDEELVECREILRSIRTVGTAAATTDADAVRPRQTSWTDRDDLALTELIGETTSSRPDATVTNIPAPLVAVDSGVFSVSSDERIEAFVGDALDLDEDTIDQLRRPLRSGLPHPLGSATIASSGLRRVIQAHDERTGRARSPRPGIEAGSSIRVSAIERHLPPRVPDVEYWDHWLVGRVSTMSLSHQSHDDSTVPVFVLVLLTLLVAVLSLAPLFS